MDREATRRFLDDNGIATSMTDLLEGDVVNDLFAVQRIPRWRRVDPEERTIEPAKADLIRPGPRLVPAHVDVVDDPVSGKCVGASVCDHAVVQRHLLLGSRNNPAGSLSVLSQDKHHHAAVREVVDKASWIDTQSVGLLAGSCVSVVQESIFQLPQSIGSFISGIVAIPRKGRDR